MPQSGYLPNHNVDPTKLSTWVTQWSLTFNTNEQAHAKPLVYTPPGMDHEVVIVVSNLNIIRVIDGLSGKLLYTRTLDPPFTSGDASCGDIPNFIGDVYHRSSIETLLFRIRNNEHVLEHL